MLRETFEGEDHTLLHATTGEEALDQFARTPCDLVLLDMAERTQRLKCLTTHQTGRQHASEFIGNSPTTRPLRALIEWLAANKARAVLVSGESGTGKELVAQSLHSISLRRGHSFVEVSCAEFSRSLFESGEMVGREHLPPEIAGDPQPTSSATGDVSGFFPASLDQVRNAYIAAVSRQAGGNRTKAAEILGVTRRTLRARVNPSR